MRRSLSLLLLVALPASARAEPLPIRSDTTVKGHCRRLTVFGHAAPSPCGTAVHLVELRGGRNGVGYVARDGRVTWFTGPKSGESEPDEDTIVLPIDRVTLPGEHGAEDIEAAGSCRYGNPYLGALSITCRAGAAGGAVEAAFDSDGKEPSSRQRD